MKKIYILTLLSFSLSFARAQRFFYLESKDATGNLIRDGLVKSSQFITKSPLGSDYIIKSEIGFQKESNKLILQIILEDSITLNTIYQTNEEYNFGSINRNSKILLRTTLETFIENNISQIILCARDDHYDTRIKSLKPKKDKT
jgi:hypothetical protein